MNESQQKEGFGMVTKTTEQAGPPVAADLAAATAVIAEYSKGVAKWDIAAYRKLLELRAVAYAAAAQAMYVDPAIRAWAERMEARTGPTVKVAHNTLPWVQALLVVRYGEAVEHWPGATTVADYGRALDWESGKEIPEPVRTAHTLKLEG